MTKIALEFHGIHEMGPEGDLCALFRWGEGKKILPIWLSPVDGARVLARLNGFASVRPDSHDLLIEVLEHSGGVEEVEIVNHHEGAFMVDISTAAGQILDARISDALVVATHFGLPVLVDKELLAASAMYVTPEDLENYFGIAVGDEDDPEDSAAGASPGEGTTEEDQDFAEMMRSLGMSEEDFHPSTGDDAHEGDEGEEK